MNDYDNSVWFDFNLTVGDEFFDKRTDELYKRLKLGGYSKKKEMLKVVVLNLWINYLVDKMRYVGIFRNELFYSKRNLPEKYNRTGPAYSIIEVIDALHKRKLIESRKGIGYWEGVSRIRCKDMLLDYYKKGDVALEKYQIELLPNTECIILRTKDKNGGSIDIDYDDTKGVKGMRWNLMAYNNLLRLNFLSIPDYPARGITKEYWNRSAKQIISQKRILNENDKFVRRTFSEDFKHGGRFYGGWWQSIAVDWITHIRINNRPTMAIDYSGIHIIVLYGMKGIDYWNEYKSDPYKLSSAVMKKYYPEIKSKEDKERFRALVKQLVLVALNSKDEKTTCRSMVKEISRASKDEFGWWEELYGLKHDVFKQLTNLVKEKHSAIKDNFNSGKGAWIQNLGSRIAPEIINFYTMEGVVVLGVHDSFVIESDYIYDLEIRMKRVMVEFLENQKWKLLVLDSISFFHGIMKAKVTGTNGNSNGWKPGGIQVEAIATKTAGKDNTPEDWLEWFKKKDGFCLLGIVPDGKIEQLESMKIIPNGTYKRQWKEFNSRKYQEHLTKTGDYYRDP